MRIVEDHPWSITVDHLIQLIERIVGAVVQIDHQHIGAHPLQQFAGKAGHAAFMDNACAAFMQRLAQLRTQFGVIKQQGDCRSRLSHEPTPPHVAPVPH